LKKNGELMKNVYEKMKTKEEYIFQEIEKLQESKSDSERHYIQMMRYYDEQIQNMKNFSDEDYDNVVQKVLKEEAEESELEIILAKVGLTLKEFDNTTIAESNEKLSDILSNLSPKDKIRFVELLNE